MRAFATEFLAHLNSIESEIDQAHVHGAKSAAIQSLMTTWLTNREGVRTEVIDTLTSTRTRPDFVADLGDGKGILIFDDKRCYIDVLSAYVIGYGLEKAVTPELAAAARAADEDEVV